MNVAEKKRRESKQEQILNKLRLAGKYGVTNAELSLVALRYGGYLGKLYELGYKVDIEHLGDGLFKYTLISEPETPLVREKAIDKLLFEVQKAESIDWKQLIDLLEENNITVKYKANTYKK